MVTRSGCRKVGTIPLLFGVRNRCQAVAHSVQSGNTSGCHTVHVLNKNFSVLTSVFAVMLVSGASDLAASDDLTDVRGELDRRFAAQLSRIADQCRQADLPEQERITRQWIVRRNPNRQYFFPVSRRDATNPGAGADLKVVQWYEEFLRNRMEYADGLFDLSEQARVNKQPAIAYQLLFDVLRENPDHEPARKILGYKQHDEGWHTPFAISMYQRGNVWHPRFGWLPEDHVGRYESGERHYRGRWFSHQEEERYRGRISSGWRVETEHYMVVTNHSLEAAVELSQKLEKMYSVWQQLFVEYYTTEPILGRRLRGELVALRPRRKHKVIFFRNQTEYVSHLKPFQPQIAMTLGFYLGKRRTAFFYAGSDRADATLFHEATHQLFHESSIAGQRLRNDVGREHHFWIVEGIALYMESLALHDGYVTLGGFDSMRLQFARQNALSGGFYLPLKQLVSLGRKELQTHDNIRVLYSQSAGLSQFLMDGQAGRYRRGLIDYLRTVYQGRDKPDSLSRAMSRKPDELDAEYLEFLEVRDDDLAVLADPDGLSRLLLGRTEVSDAGISRLSQAVNLKDLDLEGTNITDAALETVGRFTNLEELDLSGTRISDAGLKHLADLKELKTLVLTGTPITNEGLKHLYSLSHLERLDVGGTNVSSEGLQQLKQRLPSVRAEPSSEIQP